MSATLTFNLVDNSPVLNPVWWSLPVEWDFYLLAPLLALLLASRRRLPPALVLVVLACVGWRVLSWWMVHRHGADGIWVYRWVIQLPGRLDQFALGMLVAHAFALGHVGSSRRLLLVGGAATLLLVWLSDRAGDVVIPLRRCGCFFQFTLFGCASQPWSRLRRTPPRLVQVIFGNRLSVLRIVVASVALPGVAVAACAAGQWVVHGGLARRWWRWLPSGCFPVGLSAERTAVSRTPSDPPAASTHPSRRVPISVLRYVFGA